MRSSIAGKTALGAWCLVFGAWCSIGAQRPTPNATPRAQVGRVYLITVGQGGEVWEKFGHNALWFYDPAAGIDEAYNWGMFDFNQPHFLQRFLTGDTKYWVQQYPGQLLLDYYRKADRTVVVHRLNFTPAQAQKALAFSRWNARDENKYYRYDYFRDNCSTRLRDVIDLAVDGTLKRATADARVLQTYRGESVRLVDALKLMQFGIFTALGHPADRPLSLWELMFIPMRMRDILHSTRVQGPNGTMVSLVADERVLFESKAYHERDNEPTLWIGYFIVGLLLAAEFAAVGRVKTRSRVADKVFRVEVAVWSAVVGLLGLVLLLAWTSTRHVFWFNNENLFFINPLSLWLAVLAVVSLRNERYAKHAAMLAGIIAVLTVVALLVKPLPWFTQNNIPLILLFLPPNVAVALGLRRRVTAPNADLAAPSLVR